MKNLLTTTNVDRIFDLKDKLSIEENKIILRTDYILNYIFKYLQMTLDYWIFEGEIKISTTRIYNLSCVSNDNDNINQPVNILYYDRDNVMWNLGYEYPIEWLYSDFEEEFIKMMKLKNFR